MGKKHSKNTDGVVERWHWRPELTSIRVLVGLVAVTACNREKQMYWENLLYFCLVLGCACLSDSGETDFPTHLPRYCSSEGEGGWWLCRLFCDFFLLPRNYQLWGVKKVGGGWWWSLPQTCLFCWSMGSSATPWNAALLQFGLCRDRVLVVAGWPLRVPWSPPLWHRGACPPDPVYCIEVLGDKCQCLLIKGRWKYVSEYASEGERI